MRKTHWLALASLIGAVGLILSLNTPAHSQPLPRRLSLEERISARTRVPVADVVRVLNAYGPELAADLAAGLSEQRPGLGQFRVVRIPENKDLVGGRPTTVPATN